MNLGARLLRHLPWLFPLVGRRLRRRCADRMKGHLAHLSAQAPAAARAAYEFSLSSVQESPAFAPAVLSQIAHFPNQEEFGRNLASLAALTAPMSAIRFRQEFDTSGASVALLAAKVPTCRVVDLDGTHMGLLERPHAVNAAVAASLPSV
jgi:pimeloyl-ACP methyl ester carboxylesterase